MHDLSKYQQNANKEQRGAWAAQMDRLQSGPTAPAPELAAARCFQRLCVYSVLIYLENDENLCNRLLQMLMHVRVKAPQESWPLFSVALGKRSKRGEIIYMYHLPTITRPSGLLAICLLSNLCILITVSGVGIWHCPWTLMCLAHTLARTHGRVPYVTQIYASESYPASQWLVFSSSVCLWSEPCLCVWLSDCVCAEAQRWTRSRAGVVTLSRWCDLA